VDSRSNLYFIQGKNSSFRREKILKFYWWKFSKQQFYFKMKRKRNKVEELAKLLLILSVRKLSKSGLIRCRGNLLTEDKLAMLE